MMSRTQISLDPELQRRARQRAAKLGVSFAEYVRRVVERDLERKSPPRPGAAAVFDLGASVGADIARDKDDMVAAAFSSRSRRRQ
jgi:plasmid stability protein